MTIPKKGIIFANQLHCHIYIIMKPLFNELEGYLKNLIKYKYTLFLLEKLSSKRNVCK